MKDIFKRTDIFFAVALIAIMSILIMPMPRMLMDWCFAVSITFSILILMTSLFIERPLDFSSFPTILLISTMIRLALNVASTRLILSNGHEGPQAAGKIIEAFGYLVVGGNFVIGLIVFGILVIINFIVITKGSGRIAEVSARFSLDAMPGKQMAIDADLSSGIIDENEAKNRRKNLELESNFYGAMDGAAKFVRGDAIAGLLITFINIIGGIIIGVFQNNLDIASATKTYTLLTVGDGLVTQIPALIVSTAAGMLVSKAGIDGTSEQAIFKQLSAYPSALGLSSCLMFIISLCPGIPFIVFMMLSLLTGSAAWYLSKKSSVPPIKQEAKAETAKPAEVVASPVDLIRIDIGYGLLQLLNLSDGTGLTDQIRNLRLQMAQEIGFVIPSIKIQDNMKCEPNEYLIKIKECNAGKGELRPGQYLVINPKTEPIDLVGEKTKEPAFGIDAMWISINHKPKAESLGYTVINPSIVLSTHLSEIIKDNIVELMTYADVQKLLNQVQEPYKKLVSDMVPSSITVGNIQRILQNLIAERVSIRDFTSILESIFEGSSFSRNLTSITEHVRQRLSRQITLSHVDDNGTLPILTLSPQWEEEFVKSLSGEGEHKQLAMPPSKIQEFTQRIRQIYDSTIGLESPVLITSAIIRPFVRSVIEKARSSTIILSHNEIYHKVRIRNLGIL